MVSRVSCYMELLLNIHAYAGFEFDREVVGEDGDFFDEASDQLLVEICNFCFLLADKVLQLFDSVHAFFPAVAVHLGLFLFPEPEDIIGDGVVVLLAVGFLDKFLLQFLQSNLNAVRRKCVGADNSSGNVFLQGFQECTFISENLVECLNGDILQDCFVYRPIGAVHVGGGCFQAADAAPDYSSRG